MLRTEKGSEIFVLKKEEILSFATTWSNLKDIIESEISQRQEDKYSTILLTCGSNNVKLSQGLEFGKHEATVQN